MPFSRKICKSKKRRECLACVKVASFLFPLSFLLFLFHPFNAWLGSRNGKWAFNPPPSPCPLPYSCRRKSKFRFPTQKKKKIQKRFIKKHFLFFSALGKDRASKSPSGAKKRKGRKHNLLQFPSQSLGFPKQQRLIKRNNYRLFSFWENNKSGATADNICFGNKQKTTTSLSLSS